MTEVGTRKWDNALTAFTILFEGIWTTLTLWTRKVVNTLSRGYWTILIGWEHRSAESKVVPAKEDSERNSISSWPRDHSHDSFAKNLAASCPCPKTLLEAKLKTLD